VRNAGLPARDRERRSAAGDGHGRRLQVRPLRDASLEQHELFEQYDVAGRLRDHDDGLPQCPIAGKGTVEGLGDFSGPAELEKLLVDSDRLDACAVEQVLTFAAGHKLSRNELQDATTRLANFRSAGRTLDGLLVDIVSSDAFTLRKEPATP
jgi:hypothetical protein